MYQHVPNALTLFRAVLAAVFFLVLNQYRYTPEVTSHNWILWVAMGIFIVAGITGWLDGYLARKWEVVTVFGRVMDPFCDKLLIIGALIYLSGSRFVDPIAVQEQSFFTMVSGVYPWMVVLILARELLVTGIRGEMESRGVAFGAKWSGKLKAMLQMVAIPVVLGYVAIGSSEPMLRGVRDVMVYATVLVTVASGWPYVQSAMVQLKQKPD